MLNNRPVWWHKPNAQPATEVAQRLIVVTDIEGSLLHPDARAMIDQRAALDFLAAQGVPLIINSNRTRAEIERLQQTLQLRAPFISEHGSGLFVRHDSFPVMPAGARPTVSGGVVEFGRAYHDVAETVRRTSEELGVDIVAFAGLTIDEVARELDVPIVDAQLAKLREYTELFRIVDENDAVRSRLIGLLRRRGLRCWRTGPHHLVTAVKDRTDGLATLKKMWTDAWGEPFIIGFADSEDDVAWLQQANIAVFVRDRRLGIPPRVLSKLPTVHVTRAPGRAGWSEAIVEIVGTALIRTMRRHSA